MSTPSLFDLDTMQAIVDRLVQRGGSLWLAEHLTVVDSQAFCRLTADDLCKREATDEDQGASPSMRYGESVRAFLSRFVDVSRWTSSIVLSQDSAKTRGRVVKALVGVMQELRQLHNYYGVAALAGGLNHASVSRLKPTWENSGAKTRFDCLCESTISLEDNFLAYRSAVSTAVGLPCVPYMVVHMKDLSNAASEDERQQVGYPYVLNLQDSDIVLPAVKVLDHADEEQLMMLSLSAHSRSPHRNRGRSGSLRLFRKKKRSTDVMRARTLHPSQRRAERGRSASISKGDRSPLRSSFDVNFSLPTLVARSSRGSAGVPVSQSATTSPSESPRPGAEVDVQRKREALCSILNRMPEGDPALQESRAKLLQQLDDLDRRALALQRSVYGGRRGKQAMLDELRHKADALKQLLLAAEQVADDSRFTHNASAAASELQLIERSMALVSAEGSLEESSESDEDDMSAETKSMWKKRGKAVKELIETEREYLRHLNVTLSVFIQPLSERPDLVPPEDRQTLFGHASNLGNINKQLCIHLMEQIVRPPHEQRIGSVFKEMAPYLRVYVRACAATGPASDCYRRLREENRRFRDWMDAARQHPQTGNLTYDSFLLKPVQRMSKYQLLLRSIIDHTPESHVDWHDLRAARDALMNIMEEIERRKGDFEANLAVAAIQAKVTSREPFDLVTPSRRLEHEGTLTSVETFRGGTLKRASRYVYAFNDAVLTCRRKDERYELRKLIEWPAPPPGQKSTDVWLSVHGSLRFDLHRVEQPDHPVLRFEASSVEEREIWVSKFSGVRVVQQEGNPDARSGLSMSRFLQEKLQRKFQALRDDAGTGDGGGTGCHEVTIDSTLSTTDSIDSDFSE